MHAAAGPAGRLNGMSNESRRNFTVARVERFGAVAAPVAPERENACDERDRRVTIDQWSASPGFKHLT
ncbi:hypothetical protein [Burkholderia sp. SCN-KJ]|uniref:hypothetical protein n=1 Tax=Burkholderia sp. SCN-KJ TaxID=2969248 RepID=UPI002150035F|nr:hypothetical protein [Burkholderia sp. SCN-KJ]MCR4466987.1 hypothetical protein [Burkholderia sp. SCN-KJ]